MRENNQLIVVTHLSQLAGYLIGFGSLIIPLILWVTNKNDVYQMDEHGKKIMNFQISLFIYAIISIPLIFLFGLGILTLIAIGLLAVILPIINAVKASNGEETHYPFSLQLL